MYKLSYHPRVLKFLSRLTTKEKETLVKKLEQLRDNPQSRLLDIKKLSGILVNVYRLRIRTIRIIFEINQADHTIYVKDANFRGSIYN